MDTGQLSLTRTTACSWLSTAPLEDTISCDFPLALSVPKTSSRRKWIRSLKNTPDVLESQMISPYMAALRQNMMPAYKILCILPTNTTWCSIHRKHMWRAQAINFFGCLYNASGVHPDSGKVNAVHTLPAPTNITELQEFLGLVTYLSPFIPGLSTLTTPLWGLLNEDADFIWNCTYDVAFEQVKEAVVSDTTLRYFDPSLLVTIQVDASQVGLGAALLQNGKPIAFASKALTETECWYVDIERDASCYLWSREIPHLCLWMVLHNWIRPQATWIHLQKEPSRHSCMAAMHDFMPTGIWLHNPFTAQVKKWSYQTHSLDSVLSQALTCHWISLSIMPT